MAATPDTSSALATLGAFLTVLITLSVAAERMVEIVKNLPFLGIGDWLHTENADADTEKWRRLALMLLAAVAGIVTAWLSVSVLPVIKGTIVNGAETTGQGIVLLGLLASGGSGFWTSILGYVNNVKEIKKTEAAGIKVQTAAAVVRIANDSASSMKIASNTEINKDDENMLNEANTNLNEAIQLANNVLHIRPMLRSGSVNKRETSINLTSGSNK